MGEPHEREVRRRDRGAAHHHTGQGRHMSAEEAVAAVLAKHWLWPTDGEWVGMPDSYRCDCMAGFSELSEFAAHQAAAVVEALGLTEELAIQYGDGDMRSWSCGHTVMFDSRAEQDDRVAFLCHFEDEPEASAAPVRRLVSPWVAVVRGADQ